MKKKILLSLLASLTCMAVFAQDVIITKDAQKIDAKIMEVSKSEIKYKETDNLDGPVFTLPVADINSITYANGKVVLYNQEAQPAKQVAETQSNENIATILLLSGHTLSGELVEMNSKYVAYLDNGERKVVPCSQIQTVTLSNGQVKTYSEIVAASANTQSVTTSTAASSSSTTKSGGGRIYRDNGEYMYNDTYISSKEVARILERENKTAYAQWKKADGMMIGGSICVGIGGGLAIGGLVSLIWRDYMTCLILDCSALVPLGVGLGLTLGASSHYTKAIDIYNSKYDHAAVQLRWGVSANGVGLALAF